MIGKSIFYIAIVLSSGFAIERTIVNSDAWKSSRVDQEFVAATKPVSSLEGKRGVFGQDDTGRFLSLYEKDPNHPERTIVKFVRARNDRPNKNLLEYFEYDAAYVPGEMRSGGSFRLTPDEISKRLMQNGSTY